MEIMEVEPVVFKTVEKTDRRLENTDTEETCRRAKVIQIISCVIANTCVIGPAMALGYSAVALGPLGSDDSEIKVSDNELSWIASITAIATPVGCILSSVSMRLGRRFAMMTTSIISAVGWFVIYFSHDVHHILTGRAICGIAMGLSSVPTTVYSAEIAAPKLRGIVVTWTSFSIALGVLIVYILGYMFQKDWRLVALLCGLFPLISIILVSTKMPESPVWLRSRGRSLEAEIITRKLKGLKKEESTNGEHHPTLELKSMNGEARDHASRFEEREVYRSRGSLCTTSHLKPFLIMLGYFLFQQLSGIFVIIYYAVDFTIDAGVQIEGHLAAILIGTTRLLSTACVSYVSRKYGRRIPSIVSGTGMTIFMALLSTYLWLDAVKGYKLNDYGIIPVFCLIMYIITSTMGFLVMPFAMIGEIYPAKVKDLFSGLTTCSAYVFSFCILKVYPDMLQAFSKHGVFLFYSIMSLLGTIFVFVFLPETKGKTLQEIERLFKVNKLDEKTENQLNCDKNGTKQNIHHLLSVNDDHDAENEISA